MIALGLIVNPIAGMGGSVGLKGTDGAMAARARELGAEPVTPDRVRAFLSNLTATGVRWLAAPGRMGADYLREREMEVEVVGAIGAETAAEDTREIAKAMAARDVDLLVFVGGDGTARDIVDGVDAAAPVVAVPAGVKVYSGAFALSPRAAAGMVDAFVEEARGGDADVTEAEVLDIDEEAFRDNRLEARFYGYLLTPNVQALRQPGKEGSHSAPDTVENKRDIAASIVARMEPGTLYLLGPGTTVAAVAEALGVPKTLLGIDAVCDGEVVGEDLNEAAILDLLAQYPRRRIVVTPLGGNGFIFGRGNKPFTPEVIRKVGREHITVIATEHKMRQIEALRVDTGDLELDQALSGYLEVAIGYDVGRVVKVRAA
jgi:predicted polyphosphate/ATP-dependent NAD kinase